MSLSSIRSRVDDRARCQHIHVFKNGRSAGACDRTRYYHDRGLIPVNKAHDFTHDPAKGADCDLWPLLRVAEAAARDMENCAGCKADERGYCYRHNETGPTLRDLDALS